MKFTKRSSNKSSLPTDIKDSDKITSSQIDDYSELRPLATDMENTEPMSKFNTNSAKLRKPSEMEMMVEYYNDSFNLNSPMKYHKPKRSGKNFVSSITQGESTKDGSSKNKKRSNSLNFIEKEEDLEVKRKSSFDAKKYGNFLGIKSNVLTVSRSNPNSKSSKKSSKTGKNSSEIVQEELDKDALEENSKINKTFIDMDKYNNFKKPSNNNYISNIEVVDIIDEESLSLLNRIKNTRKLEEYYTDKLNLTKVHEVNSENNTQSVNYDNPEIENLLISALGSNSNSIPNSNSNSNSNSNLNSNIKSRNTSSFNNVSQDKTITEKEKTLDDTLSFDGWDDVLTYNLMKRLGVKANN